METFASLLRAQAACILVLIGAQGLSASAQQAAATFSESLDVKVVNVDVLVTDKKGSPVTDLTAADFELREDKKKVKVTNLFVAGAADSSSAEPISWYCQVES